MMVWLNGEWKEETEAAVAVDDESFLRGEGVFETMLALNGGVFELERHWSRLERSCQRLQFEICDLSTALPILEELLQRNSFEAKSRVRVRVTRSRQSLLFSAQMGAPYPEHLSLVTTAFQRNEKSALAGIKATSYGENSFALAEAKRKGAHEILFANTSGSWCEGAWSNVFAVAEGVLRTPPLRSGCLPGVTREIVLELAREAGFKVKEEERSLESLQEIEELFLTSSLLGVAAVREFDGRDLQAGAVTEKLRELFSAREQQFQMR